jgi:hypothetical protein
VISAKEETRMRTWLTLSAIGVALTACSSTEASDTTTTTTPTPPTASTTTSTPSTTSTSTTSTSTTSTTVAPTTTIPLIDEIQAAMDDYIDAFFDCGQRPEACSTSFAADQGDLRGRLDTAFRQLAGAEQYFAENRRGTYVVIEDLTSRTPEKTAATACWFDAGILLGPAGPDGAPTVVNDATSSRRFAVGFYLEGDEWKLGDLTEIERLGSEDLCNQ